MLFYIAKIMDLYMLKKIFLLLLCTFTITYADDGKYYLNLGVNNSRLYGDNTDEFTKITYEYHKDETYQTNGKQYLNRVYNLSSYNNIYLGIAYEKRIWKNSYLETGFNFTIQGYEVNYKDYALADTLSLNKFWEGSKKISTLVANFPLLVSSKLKVSDVLLSFSYGFNLDIYFGNHLSGAESIDRDLNLDNEFNVFLACSMSIRPGIQYKQFGMFLDYSIGLTDTHKDLSHKFKNMRLFLRYELPAF